MTSNSFQQMYNQSVALLQEVTTPYGFVASVNNVSNYQRIWTRDGVITGLAALLSGDQDLVKTFEQTLHTIFSHQHKSGFFPSNVDPLTHKASYGGNCGRVDNVSWAVIGLMQFAFATGQNQTAEKFFPNVKKAFDVMDAWEFNGKHLVYVPQSGNWADEYVQHGYILYDQLLRVWALELAGRYYSQTEWSDKALLIRETLVANFWNAGTDPTKLYSPNLIHQLQKAPKHFWLMGFNPARVYSQFDLAANALAILIGIGNDSQIREITAYIQQLLTEKKFLLPSFYPAIEVQDFLMQELADNYAYQFRNIPHEFHNGGLWPVWNGWLSAAMYSINEQSIGDTLLGYMQEANKMNTSEKDWGFYENFHGITHAPIGVQYCTWSASGVILAEHYRQGKRFYTND